MMMADSSLPDLQRKPHALGAWLASASRLLGALLREPTGAIGFIMIVLLCMIALCAPLLPLKDPLQIYIEHRLEAPGAAFWLGTDQVGRDILSRTICGARASLSIGICAVAIGLVLGTGIVLVAGYKAGSWLDETLMKAMEVLASIPLL